MLLCTCSPISSIVSVEWSLNHPGFATTMLGLAKYSLDYAKGPGLMQCWYPDTSTAAEENNVGFAARQLYYQETKS